MHSYSEFPLFVVSLLPVILTLCYFFPLFFLSISHPLSSLLVFSHFSLLYFPPSQLKSVLLFNDLFYLIFHTLNSHPHRHSNDKLQFLYLILAASNIKKYNLIVLAVIGVPSNALTVATILSMHALSPATFFVVLLAVFDGCALIVKLLGNQLGQHGVTHTVIQL